MKRKFLNGLKILGVVLAVLIAAVLLAHIIGRAVNSRTPDGGINESMYVDINGTKQWISIYGEDMDNPVLLYLHGGPGSSTSDIDYAFTRKWADVYTVVTWDQRNCGKSYNKEYDGTVLTRDMFVEDGKEVTEWAAGDEEAMALVGQLSPENITMEHITTRNTLMEKYGYSMMRDGSDYNLYTTLLFNPYYSVSDWLGYFSRNNSDYLTFFTSAEFRSFSVQGKFDYEMPYYNINGDNDYQTNYLLAQVYYDEVNAPYKEMFIMENTTHGLLESKSTLFSEYVHTIAEEMQSLR